MTWRRLRKLHAYSNQIPIILRFSNSIGGVESSVAPYFAKYSARKFSIKYITPGFVAVNMS